MKKVTYIIVLLFAVFMTQVGYSQVKNNFDPRYNDNLRGDLTIIANNIVNRNGDEGYWTGPSGNRTWVSVPRTPNDPYNQTGSNSQYNDNWDMQYIDIDGDTSTFSSSSSTLTIPDASCSKVRYVGLYWSAVYVNTDRSAIDDIKFKVPGGSYLDLTADEILFDGNGDSDFGYYSPYACYKDITSIVTGLANPNGDYFVANVNASSGSSISGGVSGGWTMVVVYENPNMPGKYITTFDGYAGIKSGETVDIPVNGFTTLPTPFPVNARMGVSTLEGDNRISGDGLSIRANSNTTFTPLGNTVNPTDNFFNANITIENTIVNTRNPNSINTLGWDADLFTISNPANGIIPNDETGAVLRASSSQDKYDIFFGSFDVEIIEPIINLAKTVEDIAGNDITGQGVNLGQILDYVLTFQNVGNDDGENYTIRDVLPVNVTLDETNFTLPPGVTYTFNAANRTVIFSIPNNLIQKNDPSYSIRMRVRVAENCFDFVDACSDLIQNLAYSTYRGVINSNQITDDPSVTDFDNCGFTTPGATNFLLDDLEDCDYSRTVQLCGATILLDSGDGFDDYIWYRDINGNRVIDASDTILNDGNPDNDLSTLVVDETGVYIVDKIVADPCKGFQEIITVEQFGSTQNNPISALINDTSNTVEGEITICPVDGDPLPKIFLCGLNDTEAITINIPDATSIEWEQLDESSCTASVEDCANKNGTCSWNNVTNGDTFIASDPGQYRLIINLQNGCFSRFYFNVFKNPLDPQYNSRDIICDTPGSITVTNMPVDYEYQLLDATNGNVLVPYSANNGPVFSITNNGAYTIEMRQQGVVDGCIFRLEDIGIRRRDYQVEITTKDTDCNGMGEITISATDVEPQYYYEISQNGTTVDTFGPDNDNNYTFENLNDGVYDVLVTTDDGCSYTEQVTINNLTDLSGTATTTKQIDCTDGTITVVGTGGLANPGYSYAIWSKDGVDFYTDITNIPAGEFQSVGEFTFTDTQAGSYEFVVVDSNNCYIITNEAAIAIAPAITYTTAITDESCFGAADGAYAVTVTASNGYSLLYNLEYPDATTATNTSGSFTALPQGNYILTITQTNGSDTCDTIETFTIAGPVDGVTGTAVLTQDYSCLQEGIIEAQNVTGGAAPYEYSIDGVNFVSGAGAETFSNLTDGSYTITIRDNTGCTFITNEITIDPLNQPTDLTFTATAPNCPSQTSDVTATVVNGNAPFIFEIIAPSTIASTSVTGNTADFDGLTPDTYTFRVTDAKGCVYEENYTIAPIEPIAVNGNLISNISCFNDTDGEATFTVLGYATSFDYTITGPSNFNGTAETNGTIALTNLDDGTYTITVTDTDSNCTATANVTIGAPSAPLSLNVAETQPSCTTDGSVILTANGGWGSNNFTITYPDGTTTFTNTTGSFGSLDQAGTYIATVEDANGCIVTDSFVLSNAVAPTLQIVANNLCYDSNTGLTLTANVTAGGDGNYEYRLNGGSYVTGNVFVGLTPGTHTIDVIDGNNCTGTASITIDPELSVTASAPNISACTTDTDITITAAGGDGNYVYAVVTDGITPASGDFSITNPVSVSSAGNYDVYVRDNNGAPGYCETFVDLAIVQDPPLTIAVSHTPILCSGEAQSTLTINPSGGQSPFTYSIDNGSTYQSSNTFTNLAAGSYVIRVRDINNCDVSQNYSISEPFTLSASAAVTQLVECNPATGAEVRITNAQGGTPAYEYSFDGGSTYGTSPIGNLLPGTHTLYIRDANLCSYEMNVTVEQPVDTPSFTPSISYSCDGDGSITITPDSADFDYTYSLDGTANTPNTNNVFNNVSPGNHTVTVEYISNITPVPSNLLTENFGSGVNTSITQIDPLYCYEPQDGTVRACDPGTPTRINDGEYSVTQAVALPFGTWRSPNDHTGNTNGRFLAINVGGVAGVGGIIYAKRNVEVIPNRDITISTWAYNLLRAGTSGGDPTIEIQLVDAGGAVIASTSTGNIPKNNHANDWHNYSVTLDPGANTNLDIVIRTNSAVVNGNDIAIDDIQAFQLPEVCSSTATIDVLVEPGHAMAANISSFDNLDCNADNTGSITFEVENFDSVNGFEYSVNGAAYVVSLVSPVTVSGLAAGNNTIDIRDVNDNTCAVPLTQNLTEPSVLVTSASVTTAFMCSNTGATITASAVGGTPAYQYQLEDTSGGVIRTYQTSTTFINVPSGNYIVRGRDTNLCEDPIDAPVTVTGPETIVFTTTPTACYTGNNDGQILVNVTAGNGDYQFRIDGGPWMNPNIATPTSYTFTGLANGSYDIEVKDGFGCPNAPNTQTVDLDASLIATIDVVDISSCSDGSITINATGGDGNYAYAFVTNGTSVTPGDFGASNTYTVTAANNGDYDVYVRDNNGTNPFCEFQQTVTVNPATPITFTAIPTDPTCHDGFGNITINVTSGMAPYTYQIIDLDNGGASNETNTNVVNNTKTYYNLVPGNYTINVTDASGCTVVQTPITINNPDELVTDIESILSGNCDPATGFRFIGYTTTLSGTLQFSHDGGATWQTGDSFDAPAYTLTSGNTVEPSIRTVDGSGNTLCRLDLPEYIIEYPLDDLDITISAVIVNCNELQVMVQGDEGTAPYEYAFSDDPANFNPGTTTWNPGGTTDNLGSPVPAGHGSYTWTGLVPGRTYVFYVRDSNGCLRQSNINVNDLITVPLEITSTMTPSCAGSNNGTIDYVITDNQAPFGNEIRWELFDMSTGAAVSVADSGGNIAYTSPQTVSVTGLAPGNYFLEVTEVDGGVDTCMGATENLLLDELDPITASLNPLQNISCNTPGLIAIENISGGGGTFTYTVTGPAPFVTITGTTDNPIEIAANSPAGNYNITIEDQYGCSANLGSVALTLTPNPTIDSFDIANCSSPSTLQINATSGAASILYSIDGGVTYVDNGGLFTNVAPATYNVSIIDSNGCTDTDTVTVEPILEANVSLTKLLDCSPTPDAQITIDIIAGSGNYDYEITNGLGGVVARQALPSDPFVTNITVPETYTVTIYDNNTSGPECSRVFTIEVPTAITPIFTENHIDVTCNGADDGSITLVQTDNGINPLTYSISPVAGTFNASINTFEDLPPNTYTITATGTNGCTSTINNIVINEPNSIVINAVTVTEFACAFGNSSNNAAITVDTAPANISGGSGTYVRYVFENTDTSTIVQDGSNTTYTETNILGGNYEVRVYDDKGCVGSIATSIAPFDELQSATATITNNSSCDPGNDGEITIAVVSTANDTSKFQYSIDNGATYQPSNVFGGLDVGTHNFLIRHTDTGCIITASETITDPNNLYLEATKSSDIICFGGNDGEMQFNLQDNTNTTYTGAVTWTLWNTNGTLVDLSDDTSTSGSNTSGAFTISSLAAGSYYIDVLQSTDPRCTYRTAFTIAGPMTAITGAVNVTPITCAANDGVISLINIAGGWGGYTYYVGTSAPTAAGDYVANATFNGLAVGVYEAWVRDANGCEQMIQNNIALSDPDPITATLQVNQENCTNLEGEIAVVGITGGQGSNYTYQLIKDGTAFGAPQTSTTFSGLGKGSYAVQITDQWSCTFTTMATVLYEEINISTTIIKAIDCSANPGGEITVNTLGGSSNLEYTVTFPDGSTTIVNTTGVFTGLTQPGTYDFVVRDLDTTNPVCQKTISEILDDKVDPVLLAATIQDVSCNGLSDGSITANLDPNTNGNPVYSYNLYNSTGATLLAGPQTSATFTGLAAGFYQVEVVSGRDCSVRQTVEVTEPTALLIDTAIIDFTCNPDNSKSVATITVNVLDGATTPGIPSGTSPYLYSIDNVNFQTSNVFDIVDTGVTQNITIYVTDGNSCPASTTVTLHPLNVFTVSVVQNSSISCIAPETVTIAVTDDGNAANTYTYELLPIGNTTGTQTGTPTNTTATYNLTAVGGYVFRVTDTSTGCYVDTAQYNIAPYDLIDVVATAKTAVTCFGDANGEIEIEVTGYTGPYTYTVYTADGTPTGITGSSNTTANPFTIGGLSGGNYYVTVREDNAPECSENSNSITIASPDMPLTATVSPVANVTCDNNQGEIAVYPSGGYAPYDIQLTHTTSGQVYNAVDVLGNVFITLSAGNYTVLITDNNGCTITDTETLIAPTPISAGITPPTTVLTCFGDTNGSVSAIGVTGGEGVYQYQLNVYDATGTSIITTTGAQSSATFNNLGAGIYTITVSDGWNCDVETIQAVISEPTDVSASLVEVSKLSCEDPAEIQLIATGGTAPYEYSIDGTSYSVMSGGDNHTFFVSDGVYQYYVRDAFGCGGIISNQVSVDEVPILAIELDTSAAIINCYGESTASIFAMATGGLGNYTYELLDNPASTTPLQGPQSNGTFAGLAAGNYYIRATSDGGCETVSPVIPITEPTPLQVDREEFTNVSCQGQNDGTITVEVSGGTGIMKYAITPNLNQFDTKNVFTDLESGIYEVIAQDENGCFIPFQFTIEEPTAIVIDPTTVTAETCTGSEDGTVSVTITGGTAPYSTSLDSNDPNDYVLNQTDFTGLSSGQHVILVKDANGCDANIIIEIGMGVNLNASVTPVYECTTDTPSNSLDIIFEDSSVAPNVLYSLDSTDPADMRLDADYTNITAGDHTLYITHANGCVNAIDFTIEGFVPLTLTAQNSGINRITAVANGGKPNYTYYFGDHNNGADNTFYINRTDTYTVRVVDANGCESVQDIYVEFIDIEIPNYFTPDGNLIHDKWKPKNMEGFPEILTIIFDRYGRELYRMGADDEGWNGIYNSKELPSGDYWYNIKVRGENDDREFVGHFTLYR